MSLEWLNRSIAPRRVRLLALLAFAVLLLPVSGWFLLILSPLAIHVLIGFKLTARRDTLRALFTSGMWLLPFCLALWLRSHQLTSYCLVSIGTQEFLGGYIFPGVIEVGWYKHDPAGVKYLTYGVTPDIADVMTGSIRRFQKLQGSDQVFDCICIYPMYCRDIPVVKGMFAVGTIYGGRYPDGWTPGSFYSHSGPWVWGLAYRTYHVGFHLLVPALFSSIFFVKSVRRWRLHEWRLRHGLCAECGYNLTGNESGICPECGNSISAGQIQVA